MAKSVRRSDRITPATKPKSRAAAVLTPLAVATPPLARPSPGLSADAVGVFQQGMEAMQRHHYELAAGAFASLLERFPGERALLDRSHVYLALCEREMRRRPQAPTTPEEKVTAATAALNNDHDDEAERLAHSVLDDEPDHDLALYLLAAVHARRGETTLALEWLARAMDVSPDVSAQARHDADFESLRHLEDFRLLVDAPVSAQSGARRKGHARLDR
jgi:tetratricopeptide (TPR) repeat protein